MVAGAREARANPIALAEGLLEIFGVESPSQKAAGAALAVAVLINRNLPEFKKR